MDEQSFILQRRGEERGPQFMPRDHFTCGNITLIVIECKLPVWRTAGSNLLSRRAGPAGSVPSLSHVPSVETIFADQDGVRSILDLGGGEFSEEHKAMHEQPHF
eukprot:6197650-Pleurochrysis_carterae.AAC.3